MNYAAWGTRRSNASPIIPILSQINPLSHLDTFIKIGLNILLTRAASLLRGFFHLGLPVKSLNHNHGIVSYWIAFMYFFSYTDCLQLHLVEQQSVLSNYSIWVLTVCSLLPFFIRPNRLNLWSKLYCQHQSIPKSHQTDCFNNMFTNLSWQFHS